MKKSDIFITHYEFSDVEETLSLVHGEQFKEYRKQYDNISNNLIDSEIPMYIVLSVNSYCNLCCKMCLRSFQNEKNEKIDLSLDIIEKICNECKQLNIPSIFVGATSECLLRDDISTVLEHVKSSNTMDNFLITNGTKLTQEMCDKLIDLQYERVYISVDAATPITYKEIRGGDISLVEKNIEMLLETKKRRNSALPIVRVSFVRQEANENEVEEFIHKWKEKVDIIDIQNLIDYSSIDNLKESKDLPNIEFKCPYPFKMLYIDYLGDIYPCASDYCYHMKIGNIFNMTIKEAWNSEKINELRKNIRDGKLGKVCKNCACSIESHFV